MKDTDLARRLGGFLGEFLPTERNVSKNTIMSYSQAFVLFLDHWRRLGILADRLKLDHFTADAVMLFLKELEGERENGFKTRNLRLAAMRSFARYLKSVEPARALQWQRIEDIHQKKGTERLWVAHLDREDMKAILHAPDCSKVWGRRDATMLSLLYDSGARVHEILCASPADLRLDAPAQLRVLGKGRKNRAIPLLPETVRLLEAYLREWKLDMNSREPMFFNHTRKQLTRAGIRWIIRKYATRNGVKVREDGKLPSPHTFRHSKAMQLLKSGASMAEVQSFLGHANITTTTIYARAGDEEVRKALSGAPPLGIDTAGCGKWERDQDLLSWLKERCKKAI